MFMKPASRFVSVLRTAIPVVLALLVAGCASVPRARAQDLVGVYVSWTRDPSTAATVNWVDLYPDSTDDLFYREARPGSEKNDAEWRRGEAKRVVVKPSSLQRRYVELDDLKPDTLYEFGIGKRPATPADGWTFRTMPADLSRPIRFVTGGDMMHSRAQLDAMSSHLADLDPDFALLGGDLAYENGSAATRVMDWLESWKTFGMGKDRRLIPIVAAIGNHEVKGGYGGKAPDDAPYYYRLFVEPRERAYFTIDVGTYLSLVVLDSGHTNPVAGEQTKWLADALPERAGQTFLFACYHYPAYGTAKASRDNLPIDAPRAVTIRENWIPLFERFGVTAVFENDHHNFKRTVPIRKHKRDDANGILYLGDGAWGVRTRDVPRPGTAWWLAKAEPRNHLWVVDLGTDKSARARAIDVEGETFDEVQLPAGRTKAGE
jgi:hypothetical protein